MPPATNNSRRRLARVLIGGVALAALTALSAGCSTTTATSDVDARDYDYRLRHPILLSEEPEVLDMPVGMNGPAMSPEIETAIANYVNDYRVDGTGALTIQVPTGSANEVAAASTGRAVHYALVRAGVGRGQIKVAPYAVGDRSKVAPLRISYLRVKAVAPGCGVWPDDTEATFQNSQLHNFGCASQQNLAAMVANPADLIRPQPMSPASGGRRANVIKIYVDQGNTGWDPEPKRALIDSGDF
jgi:pilus assembly protein CpaD